MSEINLKMSEVKLKMSEVNLKMSVADRCLLRENPYTHEVFASNSKKVREGLAVNHVPICTNVPPAEATTQLSPANHQLSNPPNLGHNQINDDILNATSSQKLCDIDYQLLYILLEGYDYNLRSALCYNLKNGFDMGSFIDTTVPRKIHRNHRSALNNPHIVSAKLHKELQLDRIGGPTDHPPKNMLFSPIGLVPKKDPGTYRMIHDLSYPKGNSVNDFIPSEFSAVFYDTFDTFTSILLSLPPGALMAKADIQSAFRILPVRPSDYKLLGFTWNGLFYWDKRMPMGASSSCQAFESLSSAIQWILQSYGVRYLSHILDDFMFLGPPDSDMTSASLKFFYSLMDSLNIPINQDKTFFPSTRLIVHGILVDSETRQAHLPQDKLQSLQQQLQSLLHRPTVRLHSLQSTLGLLNFACRVVKPGRAFLRRLIALTIGIQQPHHHIKVTAPAKQDIKMWLHFLHHYNGISLLVEQRWLSSPHLQLFSDAAASKGFGVTLGPQWAFDEWEPEAIKYHITVLEMYPVLLALLLWGNQLSNRCVEFHCDNIAVVQILNKFSSRDTTIMILVRKIVLICMINNIQFKLKHVPGILNTVPDLLSRLQVDKAKQLAPYLNNDPAPIPHHWALSRILQEDYCNIP